MAHWDCHHLFPFLFVWTLVGSPPPFLSQQKRMENLKLCASRVHRSRERERENVGSPAGAPAEDCDWLLRIFIFWSERERELLGNISALACVHVLYYTWCVLLFAIGSQGKLTLRTAGPLQQQQRFPLVYIYLHLPPSPLRRSEMFWWGSHCPFNRNRHRVER